MQPEHDSAFVDHLTPFPDLPIELVLHILSAACHISHETALNVSLVSSWVRLTVLPLVFSTVVRRAGPLMPSSSGWATPQGIRPSAVALSHRSYSHLLPPTTCDVGKYVKHLWIETIDMMSSPGELGIFNACTDIEDVALTAGSLRMLYNSTMFGKRGNTLVSPPSAEAKVDAHATRPEAVAMTVAAASRIRSVTLTKHTFRYDWHFIVDYTSHSHANLLGNITHLRLANMDKGPYIPIEYLPNLTHLALPYLHLRASGRGDILKVPAGLLDQKHTSGRDDQESQEGAESAAKLKMLVLTVDEREWLYKPWRYGAHASEDSPRKIFNNLRDLARARDDRLHVVLSPRMDRDICIEWAEAARGEADNLWELAGRSKMKEDYADVLPLQFPPPDIRYGSE